MSETKHWDVYVRECPAGDCGRGVWIQEFGHNGTPVRTVVDTGALDAWPLNDADRRLIAAAPELLAACRRMLPWIGKMIADGAHKNSVAPLDCENAMRQAESAIAKAEGRTL